MAENRGDIERARDDLGWEVRTDDSGAIMGGYGKHYVVVSFQDGEASSVTISFVGKGGEILSRAWSGVERLPTPMNVVRVLSQNG